MSQADTVFFEATDPRGRTITCTEGCWYGHILADRSWMSKYKDEVIAAIEKPDYGVFQDAQYPDRQVYYRRQGTKARYVKVVVDFSNEESGKVVTAFFTDSMKSGEKWIWPQSSV